LDETVQSAKNAISEGFSKDVKHDRITTVKNSKKTENG
jgi:hypothetical protein